MGTIYTKAPAEVSELVKGVLQKFHIHLVDAELKVDLLFALAGIDSETGEMTGPAIKVAGYPAHAYCRIIPLKDRVKGNGDAEIVIDGDHWNDWTEAQQEALLDHELYHLAVVTNRGGAVVHDDVGRPKLRLRKHDHQFGWFRVIAERHGAAAFECQQAAKLSEFREYFQPQLDLSLPALEVVR